MSKNNKDYLFVSHFTISGEVSEALSVSEKASSLRQYTGKNRAMESTEEMKQLIAVSTRPPCDHTDCAIRAEMALPTGTMEKNIPMNRPTTRD